MTIRDVTDCCGGKSDILREVCRELWRVGGALRLAGTLECPGSAGPATVRAMATHTAFCAACTLATIFQHFWRMCTEQRRVYVGPLALL